MEAMKQLLGASEFTIQKPGAPLIPGWPMRETALGTLQANVLDNPAKTKTRLGKELLQLRRWIAGAKNQLANEKFQTKAPARVVSEMERRLPEAIKRAQRLGRNLAFIERTSVNAGRNGASPEEASG